MKQIRIPLVDIWPGVSEGWCVPSAMSALASAYGIPIGMTDIISGIDFNPQIGLDDDDIHRILRRLGLRWRTIILPNDFTDWHSLKVPCLVYFWDNIDGGEAEGHMTLLLGIDLKGNAIMADSAARGIRIIRASALLKLMHHHKILRKDRGNVLIITGRRAR